MNGAMNRCLFLNVHMRTIFSKCIALSYTNSCSNIKLFFLISKITRSGTLDIIVYSRAGFSHLIFGGSVCVCVLSENKYRFYTVCQRGD